MTPLAFPKVAATAERIAKRKARDSALSAARQTVWSWDKWTCRICKQGVYAGPGGAGWQTRGMVHHLVPRSLSKAKRHDLENLLLVCGLCHSKIHRYEIVVTGSANGAITVTKGAGA